MKPKLFSFLFALFLLMLVPAMMLGQAKAFKSTEIHADGSITFRFMAPEATKVSLGLENAEKPLPLTRDESGLWSVTTPPLPPEIYSYSFDVDGKSMLDPQSVNHVPNMLYHANWILLPGATPQPWESADVPHGTLHHHFYTTKVVTGLTESQSDYWVYTPAGYDPKAKKPYPVLYLLHGWSDGAEGWTAVGRANLILDSLIAQGKVKPMVVVMPLGYGEMSFVQPGVWDVKGKPSHNVEGFSQALLTEVMPRAEADYKIGRKPELRAIAGLSMGGLETLTIGLNHPELFGWVAGLSSAVEQSDFEATFGKIDAKHQPKLLWIACGTGDGLIEPNRKFKAYLKEKGFTYTSIETPGTHNWTVWRDNLVHFAPLLFQEK